MKVDLGFLNRLAASFDTPFEKKFKTVVASKPILAIVGQAIADNFAQQGPGWSPLKIRKGLILQKTGLLKKSVTVPDAKFNLHEVSNYVITWGTKLHYAHIHQHGGVINVKDAKALWIPLTKRAERIGPLKDKEEQKASKLKFGKDFIFRKSVTIPARPFLLLRPQWKHTLKEYATEKCQTIIDHALKGGR